MSLMLDLKSSLEILVNVSLEKKPKMLSDSYLKSRRRQSCMSISNCR